MIPGQLWGDSARYLEGIQSPAPITVEQPAAREVDPIVPGPAEQIYTIFEGTSEIQRLVISRVI